MKSIFKKVISLTTACVITLGTAVSASACTTLAVGKDASDTGAVLVSHTCDGWYDHRIQIVKGGKHAAGEMVDIYNDPCTATKTSPPWWARSPRLKRPILTSTSAIPS